MTGDVVSNIILIGMPGAGKSTVGVKLAEAMGLAFLDTDVYIESIESANLEYLMAFNGAEGFAEIENKYIQSIQCVDTVISTGGSVIYYPEGMSYLKSQGQVVYLKCSISTLEDRLGDLEQRGVLTKGLSLADIYAERQSLYEKYADITISVDHLNVDTIVQQILYCKLHT